MATLGEILHDIRTSKNLSLKFITQDICSIRHYQRIEKNEVSPSLNILLLICERVGVDLDELLFLSNHYSYPPLREITNYVRKYSSRASTYDEASNLIKAIEKMSIDNNKIKQLTVVLKSLIKGEKYYKRTDIQQKLTNIWEEISKQDTLYWLDIELSFSFIFIFPIEQTYNLMCILNKALERYKNYPHYLGLKFYINLFYLERLIDNAFYDHAVSFADELIMRTKEEGFYIHWAFSLVLKSIALFKLGKREEGIQLFKKGISITATLEEPLYEERLKSYEKKFVVMNNNSVKRKNITLLPSDDHFS